ncbi:MAG: polysaccharide pyruvyl transferase family protein [Colwellia sp.]
MKVVIGLFWHNLSSANLGVGALSVGHISLIMKALGDNCEVEFIVFGYPENSSYNTSQVVSEYYDVAITHCPFSIKSPWSWLRCFNLIRECDYVFDIGEGDSFSDIYGLPRLANQVFSKAISRMSKGGVIIAPQTIGPFNGHFAQFIARWACSLANLRFARDERSLKVLNDFSGRNNVLVTDVAFSMPFNNMAVQRDGSNVGLNISGLLYSGGYNGGNQFGLNFNYAEFIDSLVGRILASGYNVHLISHVSGNNECEDDYLAAKAVAVKFPNVVLVDVFSNPMDAKSYISGMDFFVGSRMHATIAALSSGVPVVPVAYSRKFQGLFGSLGYEHTLDPTMSGISLNDGVDYVISRLSDTDVLNRDLKVAANNIEKNLNKYVASLKAIFGDLL